MSEKWCKDIVNDFVLVSDGKKSLAEFLNKHWEAFKPVYININGNCADEGDLYLLLHEFFSKILRSDVQPVFNSDNQLFSYFKTSVKNHNYDMSCKKELVVVLFDDIPNNREDYEGNQEDKYLDPNQIPIDELVLGEINAEYIMQELSEILPESCMQTLVLLYKGMTPNEIRKELGVNYTTVSDRIWKIREAVENILGIHPRK